MSHNKNYHKRLCQDHNPAQRAPHLTEKTVRLGFCPTTTSATLDWCHLVINPCSPRYGLKTTLYNNLYSPPHFAFKNSPSPPPSWLCFAMGYILPFNVHSWINSWSLKNVSYLVWPSTQKYVFILSSSTDLFNKLPCNDPPNTQITQPTGSMLPLGCPTPILRLCLYWSRAFWLVGHPSCCELSLLVIYVPFFPFVFWNLH
jgi:hypothetical protein